MAIKEMNVSDIDARLLKLKAEQRELAKAKRQALARERKAEAEAAEKAKREEALKLLEWSQHKNLTVRDDYGNNVEKTVLELFRAETESE